VMPDMELGNNGGSLLRSMTPSFLRREEDPLTDTLCPDMSYQTRRGTADAVDAGVQARDGKKKVTRH